MGRKYRKGKQGKSRNNGPPKRQEDKSYYDKLLARGNFRFECYYAWQGIHNKSFRDGSLVSTETLEEQQAERNRWNDTMAKALPASFRISTDLPLPHRQTIAQELKEAAESASTTDSEHAITEIPFVEAAFQLSTDRHTIRRVPTFAKLKEYLKVLDATGHITRQETVSMIPPVLLDIQGTDRVLDMCAAPGSKTSQMLERMSQSSPENRGGCLVANDANAQRAYMLMHQLRRILYYNPVALVTNTPAQFFPSVLQFDKILCDVPCTGDGTVRKNINIWRTWSPLQAFALHRLQFAIALKGARDLLKVGGTMVYSTCSQNPIENEAIVAELLRSSQGALELVEVSLDGFAVRPGMKTWKVLTEPTSRKAARARREKKDGDDAEEGNDKESAQKKEAEQPEEADALPPREFAPDSLDVEYLKKLTGDRLIEVESIEQVPESLQSTIVKSCFPPTEDTFSLERCVRCLPQDNNTGGFFVAVLRKTKPWTRKDRPSNTKKQKTEENLDLEALDDLDGDNKPVTRENGQIDMRDSFSDIRDELITPLLEYYGIDDKLDKRCFMIRTGGDEKKIFYIDPAVRELFDMGIQNRVTIVNSGLRAFSKNGREGSVVSHRISQEGIQVLAPCMSKRKMLASVDDFKKCLSTSGKAIPLSDFSEDFQNEAKAMSSGSFAVVLNQSVHEKLIACMWKCKGDSIDTLVGKLDVESLQRKLEIVEKSLATAGAGPQVQS